MFTRRQPAMYLGLIAMFAAALACQGCSHDGADLGSPPVDQSNDVGDKVARPNLRVETITRTAVRASDGKYNVTFYVTVANRGTATSPSFVVGATGAGHAHDLDVHGTLAGDRHVDAAVGLGATRTLVISGPASSARGSHGGR